MSRMPDITQFVGRCMVKRCTWQLQLGPKARSELGGAQSAAWAIAQAAHEHTVADHEYVTDGEDERIRVTEELWCEPPLMSDGKPASGALIFQPLPRWWVDKC